MKTTTLLLASVFTLGTFACSQEEAPSATGTVTLQAASSTATTTSAGGRYASNVVLTDFKINMKDIEFEIDDDKIEKTTFKDLKLKGPFEVDLLNETSSLADVLGISEVPNGRYEDIEFKIGKGTITSSPMYGKSIYAEGTFDGKKFIFWHDLDEDFNVDYSDVNNDLEINGQDLTVQINFNLGLAFNSSTVDLSTAVDTNGDGTYEIEPKGERDNNKELANNLKQLIKDLADLTEK